VDLKCKTLQDYMMQYMKTDVMLLADFFENFRKMCMEYFQIDPCYGFSTPGLTWMFGMKFTGIKLKYFKEDTYDMLLFFEEGTRGGFSGVLGNRFAKANNPHVDKNFNEYISSSIDFFRKFYKDYLLSDDKENFDFEIYKSDNWEYNLIIEEFKMIKNKENFNFNKFFRESYIFYLDANSLYAAAMTYFLPTGEMR